MASCSAALNVKVKMKKFDELYAEVFSEIGGTSNENEGIDFVYQMLKVRSTRMSCSGSEGIPSASSIIQQPPRFILQKFTNQISKSYEPKNETRSKKLLSEYREQVSSKNKNEIGDESLLGILNTALRLAPQTEIQALTSVTSMEQAKDWLLSFMNKDGRDRDETSQVIPVHPFLVLEVEETENLLVQIYLARSYWFQRNGEHESSILDTLRAIRLGRNENLYSRILNLGMNYKALGLRIEATDLFQYALTLLRQSSADNVTKSTQTAKIVAQLKEMKSETWIPKPMHFNTHPPPRLFGNTNAVLMAASDAIELKFKEKLGRYLVANRNIPPGSTLIIENPFATSLHSRNYETHCQHCSKRVRAFLPCIRCSKVVFCGGCWEKAESYHKFECTVLQLLDSIALGEMALLAYRTITRGKVKASNENLVAVAKSTAAATPLCENEELGLDESKRLNPNDFRSVIAQATNADKRSKNDILKRALGAIYLTLCLRFTGYFQEEPSLYKTNPPELSESELTMCHLILHILQSVSCNAYGINSVKCEGSLDPQDLEILEIGGGTYPTVSTINHSCAPNVYRFYMEGSVCIVKSICEIKKGEQLWDSYGPTYTTAGREMRQDLLLRQYFFRCQCLACEGNWPIYSVLNNEKPWDEQKTTGCGHRQKQKNFSLLRQSEKQYFAFKASLISGEGGEKRRTVDDEAKAETAFSHHISILQKFYPQPHKLIVECQEMLKLLWNLSHATQSVVPG